MPWKPSGPDDFPTLGWYVIDWVTENLAAPDRAEYEPFILYAEQEDWVLHFYELDPLTCRRKHRRGVLSRPRGFGKSPSLGALCAVEGLADVVPDGWDADGQPVGRPWSSVRTPLVQIAAVSEQQTKNTWSPLLEMLQGPVIDNYPGLEPMETFVNLPKGRIEAITSSARTVKGNRPVFAVLDQTEEWVSSNGGIKLAETMRINAAKVGGTTVESPNAFIPGEDSVAERSAAYWDLIQQGKARDDGLFYDHREAPADTDMSERESLEAGLRLAYGDSSGHPDGCVIHEPACPPGHVDIDVIIATIWDPDISPQQARADFLNQITHASDALLSHQEWEALGPEHSGAEAIKPGDAVTIGFDGSRGRFKGKPDATALIGCRVSDGHLFQIGVWEAPEDRKQQQLWTPPMVEIEAAVAETFAKYKVVAAYMDPAKDWRSYVNAWEAKYGRKVKVKVRTDHPFEWWMTGGRTHMNQRAIEAFEGAARNGDMSHDGSYDLTRHVLHTRRRIRRGKLSVAKEHDYSDKKIDAAVAAILAWQARLDAVAKGVGRKSSGIPRRVR